MPIELLMPALSPTMTEGNLAKWHKKEGDAVKAGDIIAEIETDKATMEFEAVDEGTLGKILVPEGTEGVKVNQPIALLLEEGEDKSAIAKSAAAPAAAKPAPAPAAAKPAPASEAPKSEPPPGPKTPAAVVPATRGNGHAEASRVFASPLARRMAEKAGLDLGRVTGSGPHGRVVKHDIEAALAKGPAAPRPPAPRAPGGGAPAAAPSYSRDQVVALAGNAAYTEVPHTAMRRIIAKRMAEAKATIPHFYETVDCEIDALLRMRKEINEAAELKL
jgi:pyruvate dehydrogenase E2 component (dihydrolipoamide acetyltransferase)